MSAAVREWPSMAEMTGDLGDDARVTTEDCRKVRLLVATWPGHDAQTAVEIMKMLGVHPSQEHENDFELRVTDAAHLNRVMA